MRWTEANGTTGSIKKNSFCGLVVWHGAPDPFDSQYIVSIGAMCDALFGRALDHAQLIIMMVMVNAHRVSISFTELLIFCDSV